jgi:ribonuclease VapC
VIVDTSALVAILRNEADSPAIVDAIQASRTRRLSAASYLELGIVIDAAKDPGASLLLDELLGALEISIEPVTEPQARVARAAYRQYGRGMGGPAGLNYGDCFSYALAKDLGEPLLFKGGDFAATDILFVGDRDERNRLRELVAPYQAAQFPGQRERTRARSTVAPRRGSAT